MDKRNESEIIRKLIWPLQVLELLVRNNEQALLGLQKAKFVESLGEALVICSAR